MSQTPPHPQHTAELPLSDAWRALSALCVGFFMILLDQTIVAVATPHFHKDLDASLNDVIWVTSVYLLTFAVPLLVTGRTALVNAPYTSSAWWCLPSARWPAD